MLTDFNFTSPSDIGRTVLSELPEGAEALLLAHAARGRDIVFVARDDARMARVEEAARFFAPDLAVLPFPAWDCLPYDRASPNPAVVSRRIDTLSALAESKGAASGRLILTTVSAILQRVPPRTSFAGSAREIARGQRLNMDELIKSLAKGGYQRADTVMEPGEYAVRGGILDLFPPGRETPVRLDFFGDEVDGIRAFDPISQRTIDKKDGGEVVSVAVRPVSEVLLDDDSIAAFRTGYRALFGNPSADDTLFEAVSAGRRSIGVEHWLPLFHERLETLFDHLPEAALWLDHRLDEARDARLEQIAEYHAARMDVRGGTFAGAAPYNPVPAESLYLGAEEWLDRLAGRVVVELTPFAVPETAAGAGRVVALGGRGGHDFSEARADPNRNLFDEVRLYVEGLRAQSLKIAVAAWSEGACERLSTVLAEHKLAGLVRVESGSELSALPAGAVGLCVLGMERGFTLGGLAVVTEQDILGDRLVRPSRRRLRAENFIAEASSLAEGDLVVHIDHGIGRYVGLETLRVSGAPHDCLCVLYDGGDKLYVPVENIDVLSRYGTDQGAAQLDRLGGAGWQGRKARLKQRIRDMAEKLIAVAATRALRQGQVMDPPEGLFDEFCARFPYAETDDQSRAIEAVVGDLGKGRPMDRLVCGDVGFGKTEVALRAAFVAVMSGFQVAVVAPTTLLARQHYRTFSERFSGLPVKIGRLSRLVPAKEAKATRDELARGRCDIVVGTHALLSKGITFSNLGLLVIDEEQHFGVRHKERLKELKSDVHVLTLTATPIPRTLQMALTGVKELSLIATPPVDRLAVRTFVLPFDPVVVREAILREHFRGGQVFYVCPRVADLDGVAKELSELVPEVRIALAHGRISPTELEDTMTAFTEGRFDVLLSTNIVESGLDLPSANTLIVHRADMFGLAQLYQLRGRVGRSKIRAYAYLTLPPRQTISSTAEKRLSVLQALDTLGAGFTLASHDLDIRGAGNLLGEEQSGHIREVGIELYQQMLEEAVAEAKGAALGEAPGSHEHWSPQINVGIPILIPERFVADLNVRMGLYRRLAELSGPDEIEPFAAELADRFGKLPVEVENLLKVMAIKLLCRRAGIERLDAGPKGAVVSFRGDMFANPGGLVAFITEQAGTAKLRPDHKLVLARGWDEAERRLAGAQRLASALAAVAAA